MKKFCVYSHCNPLTDEPFYIGCGITAKRPNDKWGRGEEWKQCVNELGLAIYIIDTFDNINDALLLESKLIKKYGRRIDGGILINRSTYKFQRRIITTI